MEIQENTCGGVYGYPVKLLQHPLEIHEEVDLKRVSKLIEFSFRNLYGSVIKNNVMYNNLKKNS